MSTFTNLKEKAPRHHPWETIVKHEYSDKIRFGHNSINNPSYPVIKAKHTAKELQKFTIIGGMVTKEFNHCVNLVKGLYKYKWRNFDTPIIKGVTSVEWPKIWNDLKIQYGTAAYCLTSPVAVLLNEKFLGGEKELTELIETKYNYHFILNYYKEGVDQFAKFINLSGRPCAYMHISIDGEHTGTMIFMLYADLVPNTCENFLRLCKTTKGGYSGTPVHRIVKDGWIQCGGFGLKAVDLDCENFIVPHDRRGVLCMANDGRHVDCSTQFFVLLQPAAWMAHKYVAFGQLIDGESTLKAIEAVPTFYESPTSEIIMYKTGILNMECQDIMINKGTNEYIQGHIEDLFALGETLYDELLVKVFLEADLRLRERIINKELEEDSVEEEERMEIRETQRFMRNKSEMDKQLEKQAASSQPLNRPSSAKSNVDSRRQSAITDQDNNDFDVEVYEYEPEEDSYKHMSLVGASSIVVKPEKPYYIALTDVPYPGEVDSTFDLKKMLRGDYCLESDLLSNPVQSHAKERHGSYMSEMFQYENSDGSTYCSFENSRLYYLDSYKYRGRDDEGPKRGVGRPLDPPKERGGLGGEAPRKSDITNSKFFSSLDSEDENEIKKYLKQNVDRVSFAGNIVKGIARGFGKVNIFEDARKSELVTEEELKRLRLSVDYRSREGRDKKVSIAVPSEKPDQRRIKRRQTGFVKAEDLERIGILQKSSSVHTMPEEEESATTVRKVRIAPSAIATQTGAKPNRRQTGFVKPMLKVSDTEVPRMSALSRLYDDIDLAQSERGPTLKDYKPYLEVQHKPMLLMYSPNSRIKSDDSAREKYLRQMASDHWYEQTNLQQDQKASRNISSDYVQMQNRGQSSIRSVEFARTRPCISVSEYQLKNQKYYQENKSATKIVTVMPPSSAFAKKKSSGGLRMPGETPVYSLVAIKDHK